jgi:hypothetical protein
MGNIYNSAPEAEADRAQQRKLLTALGAGDRALRRDECGVWAIIGSRGTIHTFGDGETWVLFVACQSPTRRANLFGCRCWTEVVRYFLS